MGGYMKLFSLTLRVHDNEVDVVNNKIPIHVTSIYYPKIVTITNDVLEGSHLQREIKAFFSG